MIGVLVAAGVAAQLGWQLPEKAEVKRVFRMIGRGLVSRPL